MAVAAILGTLSALVVPRTREAVERAKVAKAIGDIKAFQTNLDGQDSLPDDLSVFGPIPLDPWDRPYVYHKFDPTKDVPPGARRDRFLVPINSTYDLYSLGKDGQTSAPLTAKSSQDDIVRANDGGFIGLASRY
jgi:general secretion pathway protein G